MKNLMLKLLPCAFARIFEQSEYGYKGSFRNWEDAVLKASSYADETIVQKVIEVYRQLKMGKGVYERDTILYPEVIHSWHLQALLLYIASVKNNSLHVTDFGGSLGSSYYQSRDLLLKVNPFKWKIVEQEKLVIAGQKEFETNDLKFYFTIKEALINSRPDVLLVSHVIQYFKDIKMLINEFKDFKFNYMLFDMIPVVNNDGPSRISIQIVPPEIYPVTLPVNIFNKNDFLNAFSGYQLIKEQVLHKGPAKDVTYHAFLFKNEEFNVD